MAEELQERGLFAVKMRQPRRAGRKKEAPSVAAEAQLTMVWRPSAIVGDCGFSEEVHATQASAVNLEQSVLYDSAICAHYWLFGLSEAYISLPGSIGLQHYHMFRLN